MNRDAALRRIEQTLEKEYDEDAFRSLIREIFEGPTEDRFEEKHRGHVSGNRIFQTLHGDKYDEFRDHVASYKRVAKYTDPSGDKVDVLAVKLREQSKLERARTMQRDFVAENLRNGDHDAALVAFYTDEAPQWRLSLIRLEYRTVLDDEKVKTEELLTPAKRYSFRVGEKEPLRTAKEQLLNLLLSGDALTLEKLDAAFSIEPVTRAFFSDYDTTFKEAEARIEGFKVNEKNLSSGERKQRKEDRWLFTQKLFNRLLFIRFLEKKGWLHLNGRQDYLRALWEDYQQKEAETNGVTFYESRLRRLFFEGLNEDRRGDNGPQTEEERERQRLTGEVPYLNGELFELDDDDQRDGLHVPDEALHLIFGAPNEDEDGLFYRYNFTVSESTPLDVDVAVDPEMLGKVFERLVTDRAGTGSYYTPKPVVAFMCREALKGYLGGYANLVDRHDPTGVEVEEAKTLITKLRAIKVVDPACGSGAYLLGMLHELHELFRLLDTRSGEATPRDDYARKLDIIRENLYGVDIDRFAVNIAQLRLWLSLVVEYEGDMPEPLPNLHFSIGCGDALTAPDPQHAQDFFRAAAEPVINELADLKSRYQKARGSEKRGLEGKVEEKEAELENLLDASPAPEDAFDWRVRFAEVFTEKPAEATIGGELNLGQELASPPRQAGFDVVLANPPYGARVEAGTRDLFFDCGKEGTQSKDTYGLFVARGQQLLRPGGDLCYIVSDTWRTIKTHLPLRKRLVKHTTVAHVLDLPSWIFDATVNTNILTLKKQRPEDKHTLIAGDLTGIEKGDWKTLEHNLLAVAQHSVDMQTLTYARYTYPQRLISSYDNYSFFVGSPRLYKFLSEKSFSTLDTVTEDIPQGISAVPIDWYVTHSNGKGMYDKTAHNKILKSSEIEGLSDDEKRRGVNPADYGGRHLVPFDKGGKSNTAGGWLPNYYVPTNYHIDWSKEAVSKMDSMSIADRKREQGKAISQGDENKPSSVLRNPSYWFKEGVTFSPTGKYSPSFRLGSGALFSNKGSTIFFSGADPRVMLGILTSKTARYFLKVYLSHTVETGEEVLSRLILPSMDEDEKERIKELVNQIIEKQKRNPRYPYYKHEQREINQFVHGLYGLDADDIREIELWYARRYPKLAEGQDLLQEIEQKYAAHLKRAERIMSRPPGYWSSHPVLKLIAQGENTELEFKQTLQTNLGTGKKSDSAKKSVLKALAALLNAKGGTLLIGVSDSGEVRGLSPDFEHIADEDDFELVIRSSVDNVFDPSPLELLSIDFVDVPGDDGDARRVCRVNVSPSEDVVHYKEDVYIRDGNRSKHLTGKDLTQWIRARARQGTG